MSSDDLDVISHKNQKNRIDIDDYMEQPKTILMNTLDQNDDEFDIEVLSKKFHKKNRIEIDDNVEQPKTLIINTLDQNDDEFEIEVQPKKFHKKNRIEIDDNVEQSKTLIINTLDQNDDEFDIEVLPKKFQRTIKLNTIIGENIEDLKINKIQSTLLLKTLDQSEMDQNIKIEIQPKRQDQSQEQQIINYDNILKQISNQKINANKTFDDNEKEIQYQNGTSLQIKNDNKQKKSSNQWEIYQDYSVMLNLTDIAYGVKGHNKFYQIQVLHKNNQQFQLFTKWGRVGAQNPQSNYEPEQKEAVVQMFKRKFYSKTLNQWGQKFQSKPGKYTMIQVENTMQDQSSINQEIDKINKRNDQLVQQIKSMHSNLPQSIKNLMEFIIDVQRMKNQLKELNFDLSKNPLGKLSQDQIQKGYKILSEIQSTLLNKGKESQLIELSNQFYTNIPQNYGMQKLPMIDTITKMKEKSNLLDVLNEIDFANRFINLALHNGNKDQKNPVDAFYELLKIHIDVVPSSSHIFKTIQNMVESTQGPTHNKYKLEILNVFNITKITEQIRFQPFKNFPNRKLLWHGSRSSNFTGILSAGLKIAPADAPTTGYMFGKGIYFTDIVSKAANYCHANIENKQLNTFCYPNF